MPGQPHWHLAPPPKWHGKANRSARSAPRSRIRSPTAAGGRKSFMEHIGSDSLVGWGWAPGAGREPVPGTQKIAGALVEAWYRSGAACRDSQVQNATIMSNRVPAPLMPHSTNAATASTKAAIPVNQIRREARWPAIRGDGPSAPHPRSAAPSNAARFRGYACRAHAGAAAIASRGTGRSRIHQ